MIDSASSPFTSATREYQYLTAQQSKEYVNGSSIILTVTVMSSFIFPSIVAYSAVTSCLCIGYTWTGSLDSRVVFGSEH